MDFDDKNKNQFIAEKLARILDDEHSLAFYRKLANKYEHGILIDIANSLSDYPDIGNKGRLFTWFVKKRLGFTAAKSNKDTSKLNDFDNFLVSKHELTNGKDF